jgi:hypothetical protein
MIVVVLVVVTIAFADLAADLPGREPGRVDVEQRVRPVTIDLKTPPPHSFQVKFR